MAKEKRSGGRGGRGFQRGRGGAGKADERGRGRGRDGQQAPGSSFTQEELDSTIRAFADANKSGASTPRGRGRGHNRGGPVSGSNSAANPSNRGRGRGFDSPRGRGRGQPDDFSNRRRSGGIGSSPRGHGRGGGQALPGTLSGLLFRERPLLRPVVFVPSVLTKVLFEHEEDLIKPGVENADFTEQSHVPTADQVYRVFSGGNVPRIESDTDEEGEGEEEIEEFDFHDLGSLFEQTSTTKTARISKSKLAETTTIVEEQFTGSYIDTSVVRPSTTTADVDQLAKLVEETLSAADEPIDPEGSTTSAQSTEEALVPTTNSPQPIIIDEPEPQLFCIDVEPTPVPSNMAPESELPSALRNQDDDDIIVYVAPHPRNTSTQDIESLVKDQPHSTDATDTSLFTPYASTVTMPVASASMSRHIPEPTSISSFSFSFPQSTKNGTGTTGKASARLYVPPVTTPRQAKAWKRKRGLKNKKQGKPSSFGAFGAMREEAQLHKEDPKWAERRRDDSDLDWGDTDDGGVGGVDEVKEGLGGIQGWNQQRLDKGKGKERNIEDCEEVHGMEVDPDMDIAAMRSFVGGLLGPDASRHDTMDDIRDTEIMRMEDEQDAEVEDSDSSEDEEVEDIFAAEEAMLVSESLKFDKDEIDGDEDEDVSEDDEEEEDDQTPRTSFQARLEYLRKKAANASLEDSDEDSTENIKRNLTWAEEDEDLIQDAVDENEALLFGKDRKQRNSFFRSIHEGVFEDREDFFSPASRRKEGNGKDLPADLQAQWKKDREAKTEYKKNRDRARLEAAADPLTKKKRGKKGRKAMLAAAKLDPTINVIPNRVIDMVTLVQQIRRFIEDIGGPSTISLPPTNKETRKNIHEMAIAFNLKSQSKGKGDARYTTLIKKTTTGVQVDEWKVDKIMRRSGGMGARGNSFLYNKGRGATPGVIPRQREGEEVGKAAPKITQDNIGFRMLAMMGWSEGGSIGFTGGLDQPLTAIIKHTKLGLGATK